MVVGGGGGGLGVFGLIFPACGTPALPRRHERVFAFHLGIKCHFSNEVNISEALKDSRHVRSKGVFRLPLKIPNNGSSSFECELISDRR